MIIITLSSILTKNNEHCYSIINYIFMIISSVFGLTVLLYRPFSFPLNHSMKNIFCPSLSSCPSFSCDVIWSWQIVKYAIYLLGTHIASISSCLWYFVESKIVVLKFSLKRRYTDLTLRSRRITDFHFYENPHCKYSFTKWITDNITVNLYYFWLMTITCNLDIDSDVANHFRIV